jgi:hypothetical protein
VSGIEREAREFEEAADEFSRRRGIERKCVGPNGRGCPDHVSDPLILDVAHIGGGGAKERETLKLFVRDHGGRVPNEHPGGRVYLQMLLWAEDRGYEPAARLGWQCPNCNQRERRAKIIEARRAARAAMNSALSTRPSISI